MKETNILITIGILICIAVSVIDQFVRDIPNAAYISISVFGFILILIGFFKDKHK